MTTAEKIAALKSMADGLTSQISGLQSQLNAILEAVSVLESGYASDQAEIDSVVAAKLEAAKAALGV